MRRWGDAVTRFIPLKIYGYLWPTDATLSAELAPIVAAAMPQPVGKEDPILELDGDLLRIAFEGTHFPHQETLEAISARLMPDSQGKLDILDLEAWTLTRHIFRGTEHTAHSASLNDAMDYSLTGPGM